MSNPDNSHLPDTHDEELPPGVFSGSTEYLETCSLVLNSVGIPHTVDLNQSTLTVSPSHSKLAQQQIDLYFRENKNWPEIREQVRIPSGTEKPPTILMIGALALFYLVTGPWQDRAFWFRTGAIDSHAILEQGEWWRLVTALTLHADQVHLLGNCVIGGFLVHLLCRTIGTGMGWFSLITCGALGNFINIAVREQVHHSVGFSTSVFAAIGVFSGLQMLTGNKPVAKNMLIPLGAGAGLLAMLGTEGERTDLGAHFFGFACGLVFGLLLSRFNYQKLAVNFSWQRTLFISTLAIIIFSWMAA